MGQLGWRDAASSLKTFAAATPPDQHHQLPAAGALELEPRDLRVLAAQDGRQQGKGARPQILPEELALLLIPAVRSPDGCPAFVLAAGAGPSGLTEAGIRGGFQNSLAR